MPTVWITNPATTIVIAIFSLAFWCFLGHFLARKCFHSSDFKNLYHENFTIALQAFSCLQAMSPHLTPLLVCFDIEISISWPSIWCRSDLTDNFAKITWYVWPIFTNRVNRAVLKTFLTNRPRCCTCSHLKSSWLSSFRFGLVWFAPEGSSNTYDILGMWLARVAHLR